jgi:hypothetical protein
MKLSVKNLIMIDVQSQGNISATTPIVSSNVFKPSDYQDDDSDDDSDELCEVCSAERSIWTYAKYKSRHISPTVLSN